MSNAFCYLAMFYADLDKFAEAEAMYLWTLAGKEKAWGPANIFTVDTLNNLGLVYSDQGKMAEAEAMYVSVC